MAKISINMKSGEIETTEKVVGIDLGTTNSLVAYLDKDEVQLVKDEDGKNSLVPSIVHFGTDNEIVVGKYAKANLVSQPSRTIYSVKRLLGKSYEDLESHKSKFAYEIIDQEDQLVKLKIGDKFYSPVQLSAEILKYLKSRVERKLNSEVNKAVITVPAYFNDSQRQATRDAGKLAGLEVLRIVNEPTAAALAYGFGKEDNTSELVAVYDLGGGTFDVSILRIENGIFDVLSTKGDSFLGGDDLDKAIIDHWMKKYAIEDLSINPEIQQMLRLKAEEAKKVLSTLEEYKADDGSFSLTRSEFEELIEPFISRTMDFVSQAVRDANINSSDLDKIILVGGSTRIPVIKNRLKDEFQVPVMDDLDPDEVVAMGAAIQADILAGNTKSHLLLDVNPLSLGIETVGGLMDVIIPRNSKVPISAGRQYTTSIDGQKNIKISVYQGERELVEHNRKLGEFILSDIPPMAAGMPKIEVHFIIDADGILKVRAKELRSEMFSEVKIKSQYGISEEEMGKMLVESIQNAESDMKIKSLLEARNEARSMIMATEKFLVQNDSILEASEKEELKKLMDKLKTDSETEDKDLINNSIHKLNDYSRPLAERAMNYAIKSALSGKKL